MHNTVFEVTSCISSVQRLIKDRRDGFTLLEIIIVLIIIGIASGLVGIMISSGSGRLGLKTLAKDMSATLRYARNHAVSEKKSYCFVINVDEGMYRLYEDNDEEADEELVPVVSKKIPEDIEVRMNDEKADFYEVQFFPQGNSSGGSIELLRPGGESLFINIKKLTGKVKITRNEG